MSRHVADHTSDSSRHVEYGYDPAGFAPGYFALFVEEGEGEEETSMRELDARELMALSGEHASRGEILSELEDYDVPEAHIVALSTDQPF